MTKSLTASPLSAMLPGVKQSLSLWFEILVYHQNKQAAYSRPHNGRKRDRADCQMCQSDLAERVFRRGGSNDSRQRKYSAVHSKHQVIAFDLAVEVGAQCLKILGVSGHELVVSTYRMLRPALRNSQTVSGHHGIRSDVPSGCGSSSNPQTIFPDEIARSRSAGRLSA